MPLRFDLGPFEELHIGRCMIKNSQERSLFAVEGSMPILRGREFLQETAARGPLAKLYHCIQQMYLEEAHEKYHGYYLKLAAESLRNDPRLYAELETIDRLIRAGGFYRVLKSIKKLILADAFGADGFGTDTVCRSAYYGARFNGWKPLQFDLGPFEELHIGRCMITNFHERSLLAVEGSMPILKGKKFLPETAARTPLEKLYHCIQQMYLEEAHDKYQGRYLQLAADSLRNDPKLSADVEAADQLIGAGDFYQALKNLKKLIPADAFRADSLGPSKVGRSANYVARVNGWKQRR